MVLHGSILAHERGVQAKGARLSESTTARMSRISGRNRDVHPARHVLVADANATSRSEREQQLLAAGLRVSVARTAFEAIVKACCLLPDLILLDAALTDIEPAEAGQLLTLCPVTAHIPIVRLAHGRRVPRRLLASARSRPLTPSPVAP